MLDRLAEIKKQAFDDIENAKNVAAVIDLRVKFLGRKGLITDVMKYLKDLTKEEKPVFG